MITSTPKAFASRRFNAAFISSLITLPRNPKLNFRLYLGDDQKATIDLVGRMGHSDNGFAAVLGHLAQEAASSSAVVAEVERVIVTGSNIPTAEEVGPNPVDTYRPSDIEKLGVRNATDFLTRLPQQMGATANQNTANVPIGIGDGTVQVNLRGLLPRETLVLIDGKRVAGASLSGNGAIDINLIPFSMIDHIDILKDGASAVYGSDAVAGVFNIFLLHKFRGLEIGGSYGNTNLGASNDMGEWEGWLKAGTGDDKTDILIIADFYNRAAIYSRDRYLSSNADLGLFLEDLIIAARISPVRLTGKSILGSAFRLIPKLFFSANSPPPHSAPNVRNISILYQSACAARRIS